MIGNYISCGVHCIIDLLSLTFLRFMRLSSPSLCEDLQQQLPSLLGAQAFGEQIRRVCVTIFLPNP